MKTCPNCNDANSCGDYEGPTCNVCNGTGKVQPTIVRRNLMERPGYTPYCGSDYPTCRAGLTRTRFNGRQFECTCGWQSNFEAEFIDQYKRRNPMPMACEPDQIYR